METKRKKLPIYRKWDFFLAHAGPDLEFAEKLYILLNGKARVFLDSKNLDYGDLWPIKLAEAVKKSLITVIIISENSNKAYYQREEIAIAIEMSRAEDDRHRVIPLYISTNYETPYGLKLTHSIFLSKTKGIEDVAEKLLELCAKIKRKKSGKQPDNTPSTTPAMLANTILSVEDLKNELAQKLLELDAFLDTNSRNDIIADLPAYIRNGIRHSPAAIGHTHNIIRRCMSFETGLDDLIRLVFNHELNQEKLPLLKGLVAQIKDKKAST